MVAIREALIPVGNPVGRGGEKLQPQGLVLHATADYEATAQAIRDYWARLRSPNRANAHLIADWSEVVECVPWEPVKCEKAWHAGEPANSRFIGIELCQSRDKTKALAAYANWVQAAAMVLHTYGWPADAAHLWTHRRVSQELGGTHHTDPDGYLQELGKTVADAIHDIGEAIKTVAQPQQTQPTGGLTPILGEPQITVDQALAYVRAHTSSAKYPAPVVDAIVRLYWALAPVYGIRPEVALAQSLHETGFYGFGGLVKPEQWNLCGLGATGPGNPGASFAGPAEGVHAHLQHLYAYACDRPLPAMVQQVDPRFALVKPRPTAEYVEWLGHADNPRGAGWAWPGQGYGAAIVGHVKAMATMPAPAPVDVAAVREEVRQELIARVQQALESA
ncbi:MAG: N-acetylmuramoyl-L-alanine amidase [Firmicutes bacterium]|nr:N-acetylmuramoyl-L-alanine amidase [Bacillota bacterium]